ncbi:MAG: OPT/YSL family transporter, partial [Spirochaetales bacterium]
AKLPYAMGQAAAHMLTVGDSGGKKAGILFSSFGFAAVFTALRDWFLKIPAFIWFQNMVSYGSLGAVWLSPMLISVGYLVGPIFVGVWFAGALIGDVGILMLGQKIGFVNELTAPQIKSTLGLGLMVGSGIGIFIKNIFPNIKSMWIAMRTKDSSETPIFSRKIIPVLLLCMGFLFVTVLDIPLLASIITLLGVWLAVAMSCQTVGMSAINPMEVFAIVVLILARFVSPSISEISAVFIAAIVATACGLVGDIMNDFKTGHILKTDPKAQWTAEVFGSLIGAVVSATVILAIVTAYGKTAFGDPHLFPAAQASAVAVMAGGIPNIPVFIVAMIFSAALYIIGFYPVMTLGLGVYLPFYLSCTAFIGAGIRFIIDRLYPKFEKNGIGSVIAAGLLGGEAVVGVIIAIILAMQFVL